MRVCTLAAAGSSYRDREFVKGERIVSRVLPQLELTVDAVLNPPVGRQLIELEDARQTAEREALKAENAAMQQQLEQLRTLVESKGIDWPLQGD